MPTPTQPIPERTLRWWSDTDLHSLLQRFEAAWKRWCEAWDETPGAVTVHNAGTLPAASPPIAGWHALQAGTWLGCTAAEPVALLRGLMFGMAEDGSRGGPVASAVAREAWNALCVDLAPVRGDAGDRNEPPAADFRIWSGAVQLHFHIRGSTELRLHLSSNAVAALVSSRAVETPPTRAALVPLHEAIADQPMRLRVELAPLEIDLGSLQALQVGDVLTLPHRLDEGLQVHAVGRGLAASDSAVCLAHLGVRHGRRAVELVRADNARA